MAIPSGAWAQAGPAQAEAGSTGTDTTQASQAPASATGPSEAQGSRLEEIVVTAERRTGNLQRTAASISVRRGDDLVQQGKFSVEQFVENVPGISTVAPNGPAASGTDSPATEFRIRGIASNSNSTGGIVATVPATAIYTDDIYSGIGGNYDVDRVEVLRGPQGTLYGRSATSGVVAIHTRAPSLTDFDVYANAEAGSYDLRHYTVAVGGPIVEDKIGVRVAFNQYQRDGYYADTSGGINTTEGRVKLLVKPLEGLSIEAGAAYQDNRPRTGGVEIRLTSPDNYELLKNDYIGGGKNTFRQFWGRVQGDLGFAQLTYVGAFRGWKQNALNIEIGPGANFLNQVIQAPKDHFWTHEARLSSNPDSKIKWQAGVFYYDNDLTAINDIRYITSGALLDRNTTRRKTTDLGLFLESTVPLTDTLRVTGGIRYDRTRVASTQDDLLNVNLTANLIGNPTQVGLPEILVNTVIAGDAGVSLFHNTTFKARAEFDVTPRNLVYASASSSFLPGDVQISSAIVSKFDAETLTAYEVGSKNRFFDNRLQINAAGFYYVYGGYQAQLNDNPANPAGARNFNLPLHLWGAEFEAIFALTGNDRVGLNGSAIGSKIHNPPADFSNYSTQSSLWGFPKQTLSAFYTHTFNFNGGSKVFANFEANYRGRYNVASYSPTVEAVGAGPFFSQKPIVLGNINLTWSSAGDKFSLTGYVRNVFNQKFKSNVIPSISGGVVPSADGGAPLVVPLSLSSVSSDLSAPRTFGVVGTVRF